ncbi:11040_t:CDS:2 [Paraglomus brasilianum]|uniref:11040_t:CDS:1 n=1 Tax=Paraglomus brasilianum TaxID=144538 RepID=A0A9N9CCZ7_9GLOM|nr:11040_t:CDS:2 [Paraglomus brasilianum]
MLLGCWKGNQFSKQVWRVYIVTWTERKEESASRCHKLTTHINIPRFTPDDIDILVLPEMAFSGYRFKSKDHIKPYLEDAETGTTVRWAKQQAARLNAYVMVGYPQIVKGNPDKYYNSACFVAPSTEILATYQKHFLYETDEAWAEEGPGFMSIDVPDLGKVGLGICMDLNPYRFEAPFTDFEFANFHREQQSSIILCSMAWLGKDASENDSDQSDPSSGSGHDSNGEDDNVQDDDVMEVCNYWCMRLLPIYNDAWANNSIPETSQKIRRSIIFVACNRVGTEGGVTFGGSSSVFVLSNYRPLILDHLKSNEENVLIVKDEVFERTARFLNQ